MPSTTKPSVGLSTIAGIVAALGAAIPAIIELLNGVKTTQQAVVVGVAILAAAVILVAIILSRGRQAVALAHRVPPTGPVE